MTKDSVTSGNVLFACGHENSPGNHYCETCGAVRDRRKCPACHSPNREEAKFCGACGARLQDEGAERETVVATATRRFPRYPAAPPTRPTAGPAVESAASDFVELFGPKDLEETQPRSGRGGWRREERFVSVEEEDTPEYDIFAEDHPPASRRRGRRLFWTAATILVPLAAVVAIGLAVGHFDGTRYEEALDRLMNRAPANPVSPGVTGERAPDSMSANPSARTKPSVPASESPGVPASTATNPSLPATAEKAASVGSHQALPPNRPRPTRAPRERPAQARQAPSEPTPPASAPTSESSEERMANFLVEQFGPAEAAEKARANAAWYGANQPERSFWQRVADTIRLRAGR